MNKQPELVKLIDTTLCTACRGCQVACKQWNEMPGLRTKQRGSYQNPPDLQWNTWTLIRFQEHVNEKKEFNWLFRKDGCMHCTDAACVKVCPSGSLYYTEYGTDKPPHIPYSRYTYHDRGRPSSSACSTVSRWGRP